MTVSIRTIIENYGVVNILLNLDGSPVLVVMGDDSCSEVVGLNPCAISWMDMTFFTLICCKNCVVCLKRPKIKEKEAGDGRFFNTLLNETHNMHK